jgi:hypothetical protein
LRHWVVVPIVRPFSRTDFEAQREPDHALQLVEPYQLSG